jgi:hypothetical protein
MADSGSDSGSGSGSDSDSDFEAGVGNGVGSSGSSSSSPSEDEGEGEGDEDEDEDEATGALGGENGSTLGSTLKRTTNLNFGLSERCGLKRNVLYSTRETSGLLFTFSCVC